MLGCDFTQEEFIDHCTTYGSDYPSIQYTKGGIENEIRFRDASVMDYHQTVYSVSILLRQNDIKNSQEPTVDLEASSTQEDASDLLRIVDVAVGLEQRTVVLYSDGTVAAVGRNVANEYADWTDVVSLCSTRYGICSDGRVVSSTDYDLSTWSNMIDLKDDIFCLGLRADGTVKAVGYNSYGQCNVADWTDIVAIDTSNFRAIGLRRDGTVVTAGLNIHGECVVSDWTDITAVSAAAYYTLGLRADGTVVAAGDNTYGNCDISAWNNILKIIACGKVTYGLRKDGTVVAVGDNSRGQCNVSNWQNIIDITANSCFVLGIRSDGTVVIAGSSPYADIDVSDWKDIQKIVAPGAFVVGLRSDGTIVATGENNFGQCDVGKLNAPVLEARRKASETVLSESGAQPNLTYTNPSGDFNYTIPFSDSIATVTHNSASSGNSAQTYTNIDNLGDNNDKEAQAQTYAGAEALLAAGDVSHAAMTFGRITDYRDARERSFALWREITAGMHTLEAGRGHTVALSADGAVITAGDNINGQCNTSNWENIIAVSAGDLHTVGLRSGGTVVATGYNADGECNVQGWKDIVAVSAGDRHTVGLRSDGTVIAAGSADFGRCDVQTWRDVVAVTAGDRYTIGLLKDGTVVSTGHGINSMSWQDGTFVGADESTGLVGTWSDIVAVAAGYGHSVGLRADGTVIAVGYNGNGQCNVNDWTEIVAVDAGAAHTVGLRADGTVLATGLNGEGQCDVSDWTDVVAVAAGWHHTVGLRADGSVVAAGHLDSSQCNVSAWSNIRLPDFKPTRSSQSPLSNAAPSGDFDYTILQNEPGFIYDKFDDYWTWYTAYDEAYTDADLLIGIQLEGEVGGSDLVGATLYTKIRNKDNRVIDGVQSMVFLVDGVKYSFPEMPGEDGEMAGSVVLYKNGYELIKAFAYAKEVSVKLKLFSGGMVMLDLDSVQFDRTIGNMCRKIIQYKVWDYYIDNPAVELLEFMFPMEITRKK